MSGNAIEIYLRTIATGDGAKRVAADLAQINAAADKAAASQGRVAGGSRNSAAALLEMSRALEDAQYGIRGVLNNIPSLVQALGMGAGLAGGISIAAVAATTLLPKLSEWLGLSEALDDALGGTAQRLRDNADKAGNDYAKALGLATQQSDLFAAQLKQEDAALQQTNDSLDRQTKLLDARSRIQLMQEDAALASSIEDIKARGMAPQQEAAAIAAAKQQSALRKATQEEAARRGTMQLAEAQLAQSGIALGESAMRRDALRQQQIDAAAYASAVNLAAEARAKLNEKENEALRIAAEFGDNAAAPFVEEAQRLRRVVDMQQGRADALLNQYGTTPQFSAQDAKNLVTAQVQVESRSNLFQGAQTNLSTLRGDQQIARETSAAQLGIQQQQLMREAQRSPLSAPGVLGAPAPLPSAAGGSTAPAVLGAPAPLPNAAPLVQSNNQLNETVVSLFTDLAKSNEQTLRELTKLKEQVKASRSP
jgi:hypothetical protein